MKYGIDSAKQRFYTWFLVVLCVLVSATFGLMILSAGNGSASLEIEIKNSQSDYESSYDKFEEDVHVALPNLSDLLTDTLISGLYAGDLRATVVDEDSYNANINLVAEAAVTRIDQIVTRRIHPDNIKIDTPTEENEALYWKNIGMLIDQEPFKEIFQQQLRILQEGNAFFDQGDSSKGAAQFDTASVVLHQKALELKNISAPMTYRDHHRELIRTLEELSVIYEFLGNQESDRVTRELFTEPVVMSKITYFGGILIYGAGNYAIERNGLPTKQ